MAYIVGRGLLFHVIKLDVACRADILFCIVYTLNSDTILACDLSAAAAKCQRLATVHAARTKLDIKLD